MLTKPVAHHQTEKQRYSGIELGRFIAAFFVVYIHIKASEHTFLNGILDKIAICAVPFYFVTSGYFLSSKVNFINTQAGALKKFTSRLALLSALWFFVYSLVPSNFLTALIHFDLAHQAKITLSSSLEKLITSPLNFIFDGPPQGFHLWFLPSLLLSGLLLGGFVRIGSPVMLWACAVILFIVGLLGGAYQNTPIGFKLDFNMRNGPFQAFLLLSAGWQLGRMTKSPNAQWAAIAIVCGVLLSYLEGSFLSKYPYPDPKVVGYSAAVLPLGLGVFLMFKNINPKTGGKTCIKLGSYSLLIYLVHVLFRVPVCSILYKTPLGCTQYVSWFSLFVVSLIFTIAALQAKRVAGNYAGRSINRQKT